MIPNAIICLFLWHNDNCSPADDLPSFGPLTAYTQHVFIMHTWHILKQHMQASHQRSSLAQCHAMPCHAALVVQPIVFPSLNPYQQFSHLYLSLTASYQVNTSLQLWHVYLYLGLQFGSESFLNLQSVLVRTEEITINQEVIKKYHSYALMHFYVQSV